MFDLRQEEVLDASHICMWDVCTWEHQPFTEFAAILYLPGLFDKPPLSGIGGFRIGLDTPRDYPAWDAVSWDMFRHRVLSVGPRAYTCILGSIDWGEGEKGLLYPLLWDNEKWDCAVMVPSRSVVVEFGLGMSACVYDPGTWRQVEHWTGRGTWQDAGRPLPWLVAPPRIGVGVVGDSRLNRAAFAAAPRWLHGESASLEWGSSRWPGNSTAAWRWDTDKWDSCDVPKYTGPKPGWSRHRSWRHSKTWVESNDLTATGQVGIWRDI